MKQEIIRKALTLLGTSSGALSNSGSKISKAENLCEEFVLPAIEETFLTVKWPFALRRVDNIENILEAGKFAEADKFKEVEGIDDCMKVAVIVPSNLEWYIEAGKIYFKGKKLNSLFYHSRTNLEHLLNNNSAYIVQVPESFKLLSSLSLVSQISFAMYSDSLFADGLKKQYLIKLDEARRIYSVDYNLVNSGAL